MSSELGYALGEELEDYQTGLETVESHVRDELALEQLRLRQDLARLRADKDPFLRIEQNLQGRLGRLQQQRLRVEQHREASPAEFSAVKGLLYIAFSVLLIVADVSILGQVIAQFLDQPWMDRQTKKSFTQLLFTEPAQAFRAFPDLLFLTVSLLVIGLFVKIWKDWYAVRYDETRTLRRSDRLKFILYTILLTLSLVSVGFMAAVRLTLDLGDATGTLARVASAILGFTLPFVSAGFFMEGYDCLASRWLLWRLSFLAWLYGAPLHWATGRRRRIDALIETQEASLEQVDSDDHRKRIVGERQDAFARGYREGVKSLLTGQRGALYEKFRAIAVRRLLTKG